MRSTHWLLGLVLGAFVGGLALEAGTLVVLLLAPALVWAAGESKRPLGLAGLLAGIGVGMGGLLWWVDARCGADPSCFMPDDLTPWFVLAAALIGVGASLTLVGIRRRARIST